METPIEIRAVADGDAILRRRNNLAREAAARQC
jgi:hypothetical protein